MIGASEESHQFVDVNDIEFSHGVAVLQAVPHRLARIKQFESNVVVGGPSLQK